MSKHREAAEAVMRRAEADHGLTLDAIEDELSKVYDRASIAHAEFCRQIEQALQDIQAEMAELWKAQHGETISALTKPHETSERAALEYLAGMRPSVETKR